MNEISNLDVIFTEIGEFGVFQVVSLILICIPSLFSASYVVNYIFTANPLDYRSVSIMNILGVDKKFRKKK